MDTQKMKELFDQGCREIEYLHGQIFEYTNGVGEKILLKKRPNDMLRTVETAYYFEVGTEWSGISEGVVDLNRYISTEGVEFEYIEHKGKFYVNYIAEDLGYTDIFFDKKKKFHIADNYYKKFGYPDGKRSKKSD